jgi:glycosyltransferase involved in cell wall biosynthesis
MSLLLTTATWCAVAARKRQTHPPFPGGNMSRTNRDSALAALLLRFFWNMSCSLPRPTIMTALDGAASSSSPFQQPLSGRLDAPIARQLKVAILSTCALATPPTKYGGTELVLADLARDLAKLGHRPTVFATADSTCVGARHEGALFAKPVWPPDDLAELRHAAASWREIAQHLDDFDIVHINHAGALPFGHFIPAIPTIATVHHDREPRLNAHYASYPDVSFVAISDRQAQLNWEVPFDTVIHHGMAIDRYPFGEGGEQGAFLGRFAIGKAPHLAIDFAAAASMPLALGGNAHPPEREYFEREVEPRLARYSAAGVNWIGEVDHEQKVELLRHSKCLVFPIQWEEPFGLVMIEAMLIGTPVVAFACGAAPEVIEDGVTGYLAHTPEEFVDRLKRVDTIDRKRCRERARERWSSLRMARDYVRAYEAAIARHAHRPRFEEMVGGKERQHAAAAHRSAIAG